MTERRLIDTNVILRHLLNDSPTLSAAAKRLFAAADRGELTLVLLPAVLAECVYVLESFYGRPRLAIAEGLAELISSPGAWVGEQAVCVDALERYRDNKAHFIDCYVAATAAAENIAVATFDRDFRRFKDVKVKVD